MCWFLFDCLLGVYLWLFRVVFWTCIAFIRCFSLLCFLVSALCVMLCLICLFCGIIGLCLGFVLLVLVYSLFVRFGLGVWLVLGLVFAWVYLFVLGGDLIPLPGGCGLRVLFGLFCTLLFQLCILAFASSWCFAFLLYFVVWMFVCVVC